MLIPPVVHVLLQLVELSGDSLDVVQQTLGVSEAVRLTELRAQAAEGLQLTSLLLQLRLHLLQDRNKDRRQTSDPAVSQTRPWSPPVSSADLHGLPVVVHAAVRLTCRTQSLQSALGEELQVGPQPLVALQSGQQSFELSFSLSLTGLSCGVTTAQFF